MEINVLLFLALLCFTVTSENMPEISMNLVRLREDLKIGEFAFNIIASDADGDPLIYSLRGENSFYFNVNQSTGNVTIRAVMDREQMDTFPVTIAVSDGVHTEVSKLISVILDDANDNRPMFDPPSYDIDVPENTHVNTSLFHVSANDPDIGLAKIVVYKIDSVVPNDGLDLFSISDRTGEVKLTGRLNYTSKSTFYQLKINASDSGGLLHGKNVVQSSSAFASITIIDVPDLDPQFINLPYTATVNENTAVGHTVLKVQAVDPDTGVNASMLYSIQKSTSGPDLFEIDENTGDIMIKNIFDREDFLDVNAAVILQAQETTLNIHGIFARTSADVKITIGDINDNKPRFYECQAVPCDLALESTSFNGNINEHSSVGEPVNSMHILAQDLDQGANAKFSLHLDGPDKDAFSVFPLSATSDAQVQIYMKNPQAVDYEVMKTMTVKLIANDSSIADCCSTATITIEINDVNDNSPVFQHETYNLDIAEHSRKGTVIDTITATDPDTADVDNITYRLLPQSILKYFDVDPKTGNVKVVDGKLLDREVSYFFSATLQATDSDNNVGRTILVITLIDINDMTPYIPRETYPEFVKEGSNPRLSVLIQATDGDQEDSENSRIEYRIEHSEFSGNFTIDANSGLLQNRGPLDREAIDLSFQGAIALNVTATDMGDPPRTTGVMVIVTVEDINDNAPKFKNFAYQFFVKESDKGAFVGSVFADDADQTVMNNRISFRITDGSFGNFLVMTSAEEHGGGYSGNITVDPDVELDYEQGRRSYNLRIEATDLGQKKDVALVQVVVLDVDDERPVLPKDVALHVPENTTNLGEVGKIEAEDPDTNSSLIYELLSTQCQCNGTLGPCDEEWFTLEPTGAITVNKEFVIDYEKCDQVVLEIQAVDVYTEKGDNHSLPGKLEIKIDDINDNSPSFWKPDGLFVVLSEKTEQGTVVASFTATDQDSGSNKVIYFDVLSVEFIDPNNVRRQMDKIFSVEAIAVQYYYKGDIRCTGSLDNTLKGKYLVSVEAKDTGNLTADTQLEIYTIDKSYRVGLRFESSVSEVNTNLNQIQWALSAATKTTVRILDVVAESMETRALEIIVLGAYFILPNGSALNSDSVERILQEDLYHASILRKYGLTYIVSGGTEVKEVDPMFLILLGLVAGLVIVLVVTITSLVCIQRSYKRKLKAAKAMSTSAMKSENHTPSVVVPGTNMYTTEGANPVLNLNIDSTTDLTFDEEGSGASKVSFNSLDYSSEMNMIERDTMPMMIIQEEDEEAVDDHYSEPGDAALSHQEANMCFDNPGLSTTDL